MECKLDNITLDNLPDEILCRLVGFVELEDAHHWSMVSNRFLFLFEEKWNDLDLKKKIVERKVQVFAKPRYRQYKQTYRTIRDGYAKLTSMIFLVAVTVFCSFHIYYNICALADVRDPALSSLRGHTWSALKTIGVPMALIWINIACFEESNFHSSIRRGINRFYRDKIEKQYSTIFAHHTLEKNHSDRL